MQLVNQFHSYVVVLLLPVGRIADGRFFALHCSHQMIPSRVDCLRKASQAQSARSIYFFGRFRYHLS